MVKRRHTTEQFVSKLREAEDEIAEALIASHHVERKKISLGFREGAL